MKFEEALTQMREGKKIRHPSFEPNVYFQVCRVGMKFDDTPLSDLPISIVKMRGDYQVDEMIGKLGYIAKIKKQLKKILTEEEYKKYHNIYTEMDIGDIFDNDIFQFPQLNLLLIMRDDWEIYEIQNSSIK